MKYGKIIAILRGLDMSECIPVSTALFEGGIRMMEVTFNQKDPDTFFQTARMIQKMAEHFGCEANIGAGTVLNVGQVELAKSAGASYIVTPSMKPEVISRTKELGMKCIPGAMTPTEIEQAYEAGGDFIKVFPASVLGADYFKALKGPLGHIPLAAVGGINRNNMAEFLNAGASMVGVGGQLVDKVMIQKKEWEKLRKLAEAYVMCQKER